MRFAVPVLAFLVFSSWTWFLSAAEGDLASQAQTVLTTHCHRCHGKEGTAKGGFGYVLDRDRLISLGKVVVGKPAESEIVQRMASAEMPPASQSLRPTAEEMTLIRRWIEAGAPTVAAPTGPRTFLSDRALLGLIQKDLQTIEPRHRRFMRYLSLAHLFNAGVSVHDLDAHRQALAKLINSLSWHPRITVPSAVDTDRTLYRIDLRQYQWPARAWNRLEIVYPYRTSTDPAEVRTVLQEMVSERPYLRADWFIATTSRPPFYHDFLQLPASDRELERLLRVDVLNDIQEETAIRAGFNGSGVSRNNRLIERHDAAYGALWRSYDFSDNKDLQNLFDHPLGPASGQNSFVSAGGELIFNLPNGLQGYLLVDANGRRVDKAPIEIVSDPRRPDRTVVTGLSCMGCHVGGLLPKADQVRKHVLTNPNSFSPTDLAAVRALYPVDALMRKRMEGDMDHFAKALEKVGVSITTGEPIAAAVDRFEAPLDLPSAAAEIGLPTKEFETGLRRSTTLGRLLGPLLTRGGTIQRSAFEPAFNDVVRELRPGWEFNPSTTAIQTTRDTRTPGPFSGHTGQVSCLSFSADGKRAASGSEDRTVRTWDVATGRQLQRFDGHSEEVLAVAFSPDGKHIASGGKDATVRLWDTETGREIFRLKGHSDRVNVLAFTPDGRSLVSGSGDHTARIWRTIDGEELTVLQGHGGAVTSLTIAADGRTALTGTALGNLHQWDLPAAREMRRLNGHQGDIWSLALSPDGEKALTGGVDRKVRLWNLTTNRLLQEFGGHESPVIAVDFSLDGCQAHSCNSQYRSGRSPVRTWELKSGKEVRALGGRNDNVWSAAFSPGGRNVLIAGSDKALRLWRLEPD